MSKTPAPLSFQPAPRPRLSALDAARLAEASADLGFVRPAGAGTPGGVLENPSRIGAPRRAASGAALKIEVPDKVWAALKMEAVRRRVTVRFLVLEALADRGYEIDLDNTPQDGRRLR
jgi:hypothetical protein